MLVKINLVVALAMSTLLSTGCVPVLVGGTPICAGPTGIC